MSIRVHSKPKIDKSDIKPSGQCPRDNEKRKKGNKWKWGRITLYPTGKEVWCPFMSNELQDLRDRALFLIGNEQWNPEECQALRKIAEGAEELISVIAKRDKKFEGYMKDV